MRYKENYRSIERQCFFFIFFFCKNKTSLPPVSSPLSSSLFPSLPLSVSLSYLDFSRRKSVFLFFSFLFFLFFT